MNRLSVLAALCCCFVSSTGQAALVYNQNFEGLTPAQGAPPNDLSTDGWLVGANVFTPGGAFAYNYFAFPAPNGGPAFSGIVTGEGGANQGSNQLSVYSDYNNADHRNGTNNRIEANVFRDVGVLAATDVGQDYVFSFDAKQGNIGGSTTATAFMKVIKTSDNSFAQLAIDSVDTTSVGSLWSNGQLQLTIDAAWVGETLQIGFTNTAGGDEGSGVFYDNVSVGFSAVPEPSSLSLLLGGSALVLLRRRRS